MSPSSEHENAGERIKEIVVSACVAFGVEVRLLGSATQKRAELRRGAEPDSSYSFCFRNEPDLVVEVEVTRPALDKLAIFAALGVREVWRYDLRQLMILVLENGVYVRSEQSSFLPLKAADLSARLSVPGDHAAWTRSVRRWLDELASAK